MTVTASTPATPTVQPTRSVLLVEDEGLVRTLLADALQRSGLAVDACSAADDAIRRFGQTRYDAVVTDIDLGGGANGLDLVRAIRLRSPRVPIIVISNFSVSPEYRDNELAEVAFLRKRDIADAKVLPNLVQHLLSGRRLHVEFPLQRDTALEQLSASQLEVLRLIAEGLSNQEIAHRRNTTLRATEQVIRRLFATLGLNKDATRTQRVEAARVYFAATGLSSLES